MTSYSVNLPLKLQQEAEQWANRQGVPLEQFILGAVAEKVASLRHQLNDPSFPTITYRQGASVQTVAVICGTGIRVQTIADAKRQPTAVRSPSMEAICPAACRRVWAY